MKTILLYSALFLTFLAGTSVNKVNAQQIVDGAYQRQELSEKTPMPLPYVREADVMWSRKIWRIIDLRAKMNQILYYPTTDNEGHRSLINILLSAIKEGKLTAYDARTDDEFKVPMTFDQVKEAFGAVAKVRRVRDIKTGEYNNDTIQAQIRSEEVMQYMLKEEWFFNKQNSRLEVRIIGICPIQEYYRDDDVDRKNVQRRKVFWIYYPEARKILAKEAILSPGNTIQNLSFDDLFIKRRFSSYIVRESNIYNNRAINQYLTGRETLVESQRIEQEIFNFEQDLWEY